MSVLTVIARGIYYGLGAVQALGEVIGAGKKLVREARRGRVPHEVDETDPIPLTHREIDRREHQIRCASRPADSPTPPGCPPTRR